MGRDGARRIAVTDEMFELALAAAALRERDSMIGLEPSLGRSSLCRVEADAEVEVEEVIDRKEVADTGVGRGVPDAEP